MGAFLSVFGTDHVEIASGMDFVADLCDLEEKIKNSDVIITGEGSFDD